MKAHWVKRLRELGQVNQRKFVGSDFWSQICLEGEKEFNRMVREYVPHGLPGLPEDGSDWGLCLQCYLCPLSVWPKHGGIPLRRCCAELRGKQGRGGVPWSFSLNAKFEADFRWDKSTDPSQEKRQLRAGKCAVCLGTNELPKSRTPCRYQKRKEGPWERVPVCGPQGVGECSVDPGLLAAPNIYFLKVKVAAFKEQGWGGDSGCGESPGFRQWPRGVSKCCDRRRGNTSGTWGCILPRALGRLHRVVRDMWLLNWTLRTMV